MAGFVKHRRKRKKWLRQAPHIQPLTDQLPTSRVSSKNAFLTHCQPAVAARQSSPTTLANSRRYQSSADGSSASQRTGSIMTSLWPLAEAAFPPLPAGTLPDLLSSCTAS